MSNQGSDIDQMKQYQIVTAGISVGDALHNVLRKKKGDYRVVWIKREKTVVL